MSTPRRHIDIIRPDTDQSLGPPTGEQLPIVGLQGNLKKQKKLRILFSKPPAKNNLDKSNSCGTILSSMVEEVTEQVKDQSYLRQTHLKLKAIKHKYNLEKFFQ